MADCVFSDKPMVICCRRLHLQQEVTG